MNMPSALLIEPCNFQDSPVGGQLSFAKQLMRAYGSRLALVGISTDATPVGRWIEKELNGGRFLYFSIGRQRPTAGRPLVPRRVSAYLRLRRYRNSIYALGVHQVFTQSPETILAITGLRWKSICYCFAGAESPVRRPRYRWARLLAPALEKRWWKALGYADVLLASADRRAIEEFVCASGRTSQRPNIISFPTRYDESIFGPAEQASARSAVGMPADRILVASVGRINTVKGWKLVLDAFKAFLHRHLDAVMCFVGDGEDRAAMLAWAANLGISGSVTVTGFLQPPKVAAYLNAADLVVCGSHHEGWSVAMLEALACGKPLVSTDVSGARDLIVEGENGFIVRQRDPERFAQAMSDALMLETAGAVSTAIAGRYAMGNLAHDLGQLWSPLA